MGKQLQIFRNAHRRRFSGIKSYRATINDQWILMEHEPKKNTLTYDFSDHRFKQAKLDFKLEVKDQVGNKSVYEATCLETSALNSVNTSINNQFLHCVNEEKEKRIEGCPLVSRAIFVAHVNQCYSQLGKPLL